MQNYQIDKPNRNIPITSKMCYLSAMTSRNSDKPLRLAIGRPTAYRDDFCTRIVELMAEGRSLDGCAHLLGVNPDSLYEWQKVHPEFSEAVRAGRAAATAWWEDRLIAVAKGAQGNAQAIQWALRNRSRAASGWHHDAQRLEHTGADGAPVQVQQVTTIDAASLTAEQRQALRVALSASTDGAAGP